MRRCAKTVLCNDELGRIWRARGKAGCLRPQAAFWWPISVDRWRLVPVAHLHQLVWRDAWQGVLSSRRAGPIRPAGGIGLRNAPGEGFLSGSLERAQARQMVTPPITPPAPRSVWPRFSLRRLFGWTLMVCILLAVARWVHVQIIWP